MTLDINTNNISSKIKNKPDLILWRRGQVAELCSKGYRVMEIAKELQVSHSTIINDIKFITEQSQQNLKDLIEVKLPKEFELTIIGLTSILRESWDAAQESTNPRDKLSALALAKECYSLKLDMLTNAHAINTAIDFVRKKKQWREAEQKAATVEAKPEQEQELTDCERLEEDLKYELTDPPNNSKQEQESNIDDNPEAQF